MGILTHILLSVSVTLWLRTMSQKSIIYLGLFIGSTIGAFIPVLWGDSMFSISAVLFSGIGGIVGIVAGYKLTT